MGTLIIIWLVAYIPCGLISLWLAKMVLYDTFGEPKGVPVNRVSFVLALGVGGLLVLIAITIGKWPRWWRGEWLYKDVEEYCPECWIVGPPIVEDYSDCAEDYPKGFN